MTPFGGVDTITVLHQGMRVAHRNHTLIANNIANVDTPGYDPTRLDFQASLRAALQGQDRIALRRTDPRHLEANIPNPSFERLALSSKNDYNKVDLDQEIVLMDENTGKYTTYGRILGKKFGLMKDMLANIR